MPCIFCSLCRYILLFLSTIKIGVSVIHDIKSFSPRFELTLGNTDYLLSTQKYDGLVSLAIAHGLFVDKVYTAEDWRVEHERIASLDKCEMFDTVLINFDSLDSIETMQTVLEEIRLEFVYNEMLKATRQEDPLGDVLAKKFSTTTMDKMKMSRRFPVISNAERNVMTKDMTSTPTLFADPATKAEYEALEKIESSKENSTLVETVQAINNGTLNDSDDVDIEYNDVKDYAVDSITGNEMHNETALRGGMSMHVEKFPPFIPPRDNDETIDDDETMDDEGCDSELCGQDVQSSQARSQELATGPWYRTAAYEKKIESLQYANELLKYKKSPTSKILLDDAKKIFAWLSTDD